MISSAARWSTSRSFPDDVDVTLVEGAVSSEEDLHKIRIIRQRTKTLVSLGDCAVTANVPAMRNPFGVERDLRSRLPREHHSGRAECPTRSCPQLLPRAVPVHEVVTVDVFVPGCPPRADLIFYCAQRTARGASPGIEREDALWSLVTCQMLPTRRFVIDPVTRIEGHAKITLHLDDMAASKTPTST